MIVRWLIGQKIVRILRTLEGIFCLVVIVIVFKLLSGIIMLISYTHKIDFCYAIIKEIYCLCVYRNIH